MRGKAVLGVPILRVGVPAGPFNLGIVVFARLAGIKRDTADLPASFGWPDWRFDVDVVAKSV